MHICPLFLLSARQERRDCARFGRIEKSALVVFCILETNMHKKRPPRPKSGRSDERAGGGTRSNIKADSLDRDLSVALCSDDELVTFVRLRTISCPRAVAAEFQERA